MAEKEKSCEKCGDFENFSVNKAENGYKISACFQKKKKSIGEKAGWYPSTNNTYKEYVATSKPEMFSRIEKIMSGECGCK